MTDRYKITFYRTLTGERGDMADTGINIQTNNLTEPEARTIKNIRIRLPKRHSLRSESGYFTISGHSRRLI